jgi:tRNA(fMet)-specific endonuclease VapC
MLILDTDHLVEYQKGTSPAALRLRDKLQQANESFSTSIITVEEVMRGWLAAIRRTAKPHDQIKAYSRLRNLFRFFATWEVIDWTNNAADTYAALKQDKTRIGSMDLKIASIALTNHATLLSRILNDFQRVPGLRVENWLE